MDALPERRRAARITLSAAAAVVAVAAGACLMVALDRLWLDALSLVFHRGFSQREAALSVLMLAAGAAMVPAAMWLSTRARLSR